MRPDPKPTTWKSTKYEAYIRSIPCLLCGYPSECHHVDMGKSGMGKKAPSSHCIPLCRLHHAELHHYGQATFFLNHNINVERLIIGYLTEYLSKKG